ncbi:Pirin [Neolecta irregularis DAH-3]|uniref:Pirin n=1 Tax=Neolecta irregularis (strain DAH-3) TaxID=1198029 RepID=A0A1U7LI32_NEOID|nr:Pirin [Neolecta irregularis DAH-3]|eukprot:OLL22315.1 Pirin [Neolecta irregularis DAH-3]
MIPRFQTRNIAKIIQSTEQKEGVGARVRRSIGSVALPEFSPFLMLDHFKVEEGAGFPDHPHRGQETVTYMLKGAFDHEDFTGHRGRINAGDLQWMTAGKGIVHSEMPVPGEVNEGLQLWVDLPSEKRLCEPRYQELKSDDIPKWRGDNNVVVKVIAGRAGNIKSPVQTYTKTWYLDITIERGGQISQIIPHNWNAFIYTIQGNASISSHQVGPFHTVVLDLAGEGVTISNESKETVRMVLIAGERLDQRQRTYQHGPFVMDDQAGVMRTIHDYQTGTNGFERARDWRSEIGSRMTG